MNAFKSSSGLIKITQSINHFNYGFLKFPSIDCKMPSITFIVYCVQTGNQIEKLKKKNCRMHKN
jgi:hypothetical protein